MTEIEVRQRVEAMMQEYDVIISIPVTAGFMGDMEAICMYPAIKERMMESEKPLRTTGAAPNGNGLKAFVFGESYKMKAHPEYLESFVRMSKQFGDVQDILGTKYD